MFFFFSRDVFLFSLSRFSYCTISSQWVHPWVREGERRCLKIEDEKKTLKCCYIAHLSQPSSGGPGEIHHRQSDGNSPQNSAQTVSKLRDMAKGETKWTNQFYLYSPTRLHWHTCVRCGGVFVSAGLAGYGGALQTHHEWISLDFVLERVGCILIEIRASRP